MVFEFTFTIQIYNPKGIFNGWVFQFMFSRRNYIIEAIFKRLMFQFTFSMMTWYPGSNIWGIGVPIYIVHKEITSKKQYLRNNCSNIPFPKRNYIQEAMFKKWVFQFTFSISKSYLGSNLLEIGVPIYISYGNLHQYLRDS